MMFVDMFLALATDRQERQTSGAQISFARTPCASDAQS